MIAVYHSMFAINTHVRPFTKLYAADVTAGSITAPSATATEPTGDGVLEALAPSFRADGGYGVNQFHFSFYGAGSADQTATALIVGWRKAKDVWIPIPLLGVDLTLGTAVGVAATSVLDTENFIDTISVTSGKDYTGAYELMSKADNSIASLKLDVFGCQKVQVLLAVSDATSVNCLGAGF